MANVISKLGQNQWFVLGCGVISSAAIVIEHLRSPFKFLIAAGIALILIALSEHIQITAFFAHAGVAALLVEHLPSVHGRWPWAIAIVIFGAFKEYWFDAKYETDPPQTFADNSQDFIGYVVGVVVGLL